VSVKTSGFLISYNNARIVETALRSLRFVDQLIVVDKSSTDGAAEICQRYADIFISVPWSPTVEATRAHALELCQGENIVFLDDDECLSVDAIKFIRTESKKMSADVFSFPRRDYILGRHSESAHYWPEHHVRFFRRGTVEFAPTVHAGINVLSRNIMNIPASSAYFIHHLSHANASVWIEKTNRYTSQPDRHHDIRQATISLMEYADSRFVYWKSRLKSSAGPYDEAVLLLRLVYDLVDATKVWEVTSLPDGHKAFQEICQTLMHECDKLSEMTDIKTTCLTTEAHPQCWGRRLKGFLMQFYKR